MGHHTLFSVVDASLALDNSTGASYYKFLIARAVQDCEAVEAACVSQVITVEMSVPHVPYAQCSLLSCCFTVVSALNKYPPAVTWKLSKGFCLLGLYPGKDPGNWAFICESTDGGNIWELWGGAGKRLFANLCMLPN